MENLYEIHSRFIKDVLEVNKLNSYTISIFPSVFFLITTFLIIHKFCHRFTRIGFTRYKTWFFRELTFHWTFFYMTKFWFLFIRGYKVSVSHICESIFHDVSIHICNIVSFTILMIISTTPFIMYTIRRFNRNRIPNFLMWIGEDPWVRTEIGISGHYLSRPAPIPLVSRKQCAYHTRRSSSAETTSAIVKSTTIRISKSVETSKCVKNVEDLYA